MCHVGGVRLCHSPATSALRVADRLRVTMRERDPADLRDDDFAAFLASSPSGSEDSDAHADDDGIRVEGDAAAVRVSDKETRQERAKRKVDWGCTMWHCVLLTAVVARLTGARALQLALGRNSGLSAALVWS